MNKVVDLSEVLANAPRNCWLALNEEETAIVGRGDTMKGAVEEARRNGVEDAILLWSPKAWIPSVY